ncbi:hypothetical protein [Pedobacter frigidisoli]|uniref:hypothetical protein n=1 Tax=Pedobacter frigidisoli TaxID=2530455 RepID=UPI0029308EBE|nr:hypothetical protein [Pedobacter frigidisoli]
MNSLKTLHYLREALHKKFGSTSIDRQLCEQISVAIFTQQKDYISTTTLMKLFGLLPMEQRVFPPQIVDMIIRYLDGKTDEANDSIFRVDNSAQKTSTKRI